MPKVSAVLPSSLADALARRAELHDRSLSAEIRQAVRAYLSSTDRGTPQIGSDPDTKEATP